jgi:uncharacterized membrane protein
MAGAVKSHWVKIALGLSLALNIFFVGMAGGKLFHGKPESRDSAPNSFLQTLSDERAAEVREAFAKMREARRGGREERRAAWAKVREVMTAETFDRAAMQAAMDDVMRERSERTERRYAQMIDFVATMSLEERVAFSDAMRERWRKRRARREREEG